MTSSTSKLATRQSALPVVANEIATQLDLTAKNASYAFSIATKDGGSMVAALNLAQSINNLRELFSLPEIQATIQSLQDTPLGFRTDRDPSIINKKTNMPQKPYEYAVVKECVIEALLRGLQLVGNQFNIIAGRCYCTKEGFEGLIKAMASVTQFKLNIGVPLTRNGMVTVACNATWVQNGEPASLEAEIPIKAFENSNADQLIGKATRKFLARCYQQMSGFSIPEGDMEVASVSVLQNEPPKGLNGLDRSESNVHLAKLTEDQQHQIMTAAERVLTKFGVQTFIEDMKKTFEVSNLNEIPSEKFTAIMQGVVNNVCKERWNNGCSAKTNERLLEDPEVAPEVADAIQEELV